MKALAPAKVNLSLRVFPAREDGFHPLDSIVQTIDAVDELWAIRGGPDQVSDVLGVRDGEAIEDRGERDNLVSVAISALRAAGAEIPWLGLVLLKHLPVAAGLGGGSADAAAALLLGAAHADGPTPDLEVLGATVGSDVPVLLRGGTVRMQGRGEVLTDLPFAGGYGLLLVAPPFELSTPAVFRRWDELGGPEGSAVPVDFLPDSLETFAPLVNDLTPAAEDLEPQVAVWRRRLSNAFERPFLLSGSGPSLFAFFESKDAAETAAAGEAALLADARFVRAAEPVPWGAKII